MAKSGVFGRKPELVQAASSAARISSGEAQAVSPASIIVSTSRLMMALLTGVSSCPRRARLLPKPVANLAAVYSSMTLYAADGSTFSWQIDKSAAGGFDGSFRVERRVGDQAYSESDTHDALL